MVKADGLAAGKGVTVCDDESQAAEAVRAAMSGRAFGEAGATVLLEERLEGPEVSVFAFTDGEHIAPLVAACDYKRLGDGDHGPNTGGMGSYSPPAFWSTELSAQVESRVMRPVIDSMAERGTPYRGVLYAGLMLTAMAPGFWSSTAVSATLRHRSSCRAWLPTRWSLCWPAPWVRPRVRWTASTSVGTTGTARGW